MACKNWYVLGEKRISIHLHKTGPWYLLGVLFKISDDHRRPFFIGVLPQAFMHGSYILDTSVTGRVKYRPSEDATQFTYWH